MGSSAAEIQAEIEAAARASSEPREHLDELLQKGVKYAQSIAPVGQVGDPHPGKFRDSIHSEHADDVDGMPAGRIVSDDPEAGYIEFGTQKTPEHGTFAKTHVYLEQQEKVAEETEEK